MERTTIKAGTLEDMTNRSGKKGWAGESPVWNWFKDHGFHRSYRLRTQGVMDKGDIGGIDDIAIEIKNQGTYKFAEWMKETEKEKANANARLGALVVKPKGIGETRVGSWWVMMTLSDFTTLLIDANYGPRDGA